MITYDAALKAVVKHARRGAVVRASLHAALGMVLAEDIRTRSPLPRFDASAVDGFAVRAGDVARAKPAAPVKLALQYTIRAGDMPGEAIRKGHAVKVLTGAPLPADATGVVMKEHVFEGAEEIRVAHPVDEEAGIRRAGKEFAKGAVVFRRGTPVTPGVIGMLATIGCESVRVYKRPRVALIVTGNELRTPSARLKPGEIYDSNSYAIAAALRSMGIEPVMIARVRDAESDVRKSVARALGRCDALITVGGVSVGDYDFVKDVLASLGVQRIFWSVAMKPGKPNFFGVVGKKVVFGLPGNPVSALVSFLVLVKPGLSAMMGDVRPLPRLKAVLTAELSKREGRVDFVRGVYGVDAHDEIAVAPTAGQDSHMVGGIAAANCLIIFPKDATRIGKGSIVDVLPLGGM